VWEVILVTMKPTSLVFILATVMAAPAAAQRSSVKVYLFTKADPSGFVDKDYTERQEATEAIRQSLRKKVTLVETPDVSDVQVEITAVHMARFSGPQIEARLSHGSYQTMLGGRNGMASRARGSLVKEIERWIDQNAARLGR
jgi:hypothetical protein